MRIRGMKNSERSPLEAGTIDWQAVVTFADALPQAERRGRRGRVVGLDVVTDCPHRTVTKDGVEGARMCRTELIEAVLPPAIWLRRYDAPADFVAVPAGGEALVIVRLG